MKGEGVLGKVLMPAEEYFYVVFRVLVGLFYFLHGGMKVLWPASPMPTLFVVVGWFEVLAGLLILFGLFTRLGALIGAVIMIVAYFKVHAAGGLNPLVNGGELALLFLVSFLILLVHGSGKFGVEHWMKKKEKI